MNITEQDLKTLNTIALVKTQDIGMQLLRQQILTAENQLKQARESLQHFLFECLEENGGSRQDPWNWDDNTCKWTLKSE
tara:strand:+ start:400 stop:636 length:237 start_codon:yes stop_codon:yes gene_type:complete